MADYATKMNTDTQNYYFGYLTRPSYGEGSSSTPAATQGVNSIETASMSDPRGSLFKDFDVSGWNGTPQYSPDEKILNYYA